MIAGATEAEEDSADAEAQDPAEDVKRIFDADNIKDAEALRRRLLDAVDPLSKFILDKTTGLREVLDASNASESEL
jgi:inactivated superfamily I helicase